MISIKQQMPYTQLDWSLVLCRRRIHLGLSFWKQNI